MSILFLVSWPFTALGVLLVVSWVRLVRQAGIDGSNVFNPIRLTWFLFTRPDKFAALRNADGSLAFPWLARDEWENVSG